MITYWLITSKYSKHWFKESICIQTSAESMNTWTSPIQDLVMLVLSCYLSESLKKMLRRYRNLTKNLLTSRCLKHTRGDNSKQSVLSNSLQQRLFKIFWTGKGKPLVKIPQKRESFNSKSTEFSTSQVSLVSAIVTLFKDLVFQKSAGNSYLWFIYYLSLFDC